MGAELQSSSEVRLSGATILPASNIGLVSVIIPAFNAARTVERTASSALNQTYSKIEVLVVDDGSTDETAEIVRRMAALDGRLTLLQKSNGGLVSARNYAIEHARGEFIAPLDADDLWHRDKLKKQVAAMQDDIGLVYCWSRAIDEQDRVLFDLPPCSLRGDVYAALVIKNFLHSGAPLIRKSCVDAVGGYDASLSARGAPYCEDIKFNLDIAEHCDFEVVPEFLSAYRQHPGSMSRNRKTMLRSRKVVLDDARARHPELPGTLFRWAHAYQNLEYGLFHIAEGGVFRGSWLLVKALIADPAAMLRFGALRIVARASRLGFAAPLQSNDTRDLKSAVHSLFTEADPAVRSRPAPMPWTNARLTRIAGFVVRRQTRRTTQDQGSAQDGLAQPLPHVEQIIGYTVVSVLDGSRVCIGPNPLDSN
jgi:glycosyltransferase involved in cell wall biosynthesis